MQSCLLHALICLQAQVDALYLQMAAKNIFEYVCRSCEKKMMN